MRMMASQFRWRILANQSDAPRVSSISAQILTSRADMPACPKQILQYMSITAELKHEKWGPAAWIMCVDPRGWIFSMQNTAQASHRRSPLLFTPTTCQVVILQCSASAGDKTAVRSVNPRRNTKQWE